MENESQEQINNRPWLYKKGQSGNPGGRPKGSKSMKTWVKEKLETMTDDERETFLEGLSKEIIWKLAEGNPDNKLQGDANNPITLVLQDINGNTFAKNLQVEKLPDESTTSTPTI